MVNFQNTDDQPELSGVSSPTDEERTDEERTDEVRTDEVSVEPESEDGDAKIVGAEIVGTETVGVETVGVETVGVETVGTETVGVETVGTETVGVETVGTDVIDEVIAAVIEGAAAEAAAEAADAMASAVLQPPRTIPLAEMTPEERFRATTKLIFLAPDVSPVPPRSRRESGRGDLRELDEIFDQRSERLRHTREGRYVERDRTRSRDVDTAEENDERDANSRRRTRRRPDNESDQEDEPRRVISRERPPAPLITEPQKIKGSTRLEAKKQRRRDGREAGRRRVVVTESEFLARRESVDRVMVVRSQDERIQIGVLEDSVLVEHYVARSSESSLIGNVYLGRVQNVLPSMEAAFVDIGRGRNAVLYSGEVDWTALEGGNTARRIENVLKPGDQVLVQVTKDPVGHKGARLTSQVSLPGRFLVYVPGGSMNGISRKLPDTERARLKKILKEALPTGVGVIVRTAAEGASEEQLTLDVQRLTRQWESIQERTGKGGAPALLHSEPDMLIKIVRDVFNEDFHRMVISGESTYQTIQEYLGQIAPDLLERTHLFVEDRDIFDEFRVTEQISKALDRKVWLPSGGSLVIDRTEAMTVVDVNTGKFVGSGGNLEETVTKNNLEAAEEIVRQLRLRDIGGIIVVDYIDMVLESNRDLVLRRMVECLSRDRTKHQVAEVTSLGLVQMTRKKLGLGLLESFSDPCDSCAGRGIVVHHDPVHRHRSDVGPGGGASSVGSVGGNSRGRRKNGSTPPPPTQTHSITDGAKNMLATVAARTIAEAHKDESAGIGPSHTDAALVDEPSVQGAIPSSGRVRSRRSKNEASRADRAAEAVAELIAEAPIASRDAAAASPADSEAVRSVSELLGQAMSAANAGSASASTSSQSRTEEPLTGLLDSVLDALPEAPAPGQSRQRRRRVSTGAIRGGPAIDKSE
jgi:ribonuclease E